MIIDCTTLDIKKINEGIHFYRADHRGDYPRYLVMNHRSFYEFRATTFSSLCFTKDEDGYLTYWDIPVAICDKLKYGEVDFV